MSEYFIALDQGTTSSRTLLFTPDFDIVDQAQEEFTQHFPQPGWVEHDAEEILASQLRTLETLVVRNHLRGEQIAAVGITNQRETVVAWDKRTGKALARAIVWQDRRTSAFCAQLKKKKLEKTIRDCTGLVVDPYFSATKMRWLLINNPEVKRAAREKTLAFGTIDSWLVFRLTGGRHHVIEVGNASRTSLMNIRTLRWDAKMLRLFGIPASALPDILASDAHFGDLQLPFLSGPPVHGVAGDQQASLFGHRCLKTGDMKNTYGTGCFMLQNIGTSYKAAPKGLLGTVAWNLGGKTTYAHEGAVLVGGAAVQFLRDQLQIIGNAAESQALAESLPSNEGVYFVPAFAGLGTPHWDPTARGLLIGLTRGTTKAHFCRAALEAIAYQTLDLWSRYKSPKTRVLKADGGASGNAFLMQFQADMLKAEVTAGINPEVTALGAAMLAALGCGRHTLKSLADISLPVRTYRPRLDTTTRKLWFKGWQEAVKRSRHWAVD